MSTRREALKLYRDILRAVKYFPHRNEQGVPWAEVLRKSARKEFEEAKFLRDPLEITRLLVVGRDCLDKTLEKMSAANQAVRDHIDKTRTR
jgi:hypothetical protein